jgi:hypothetical protein
LLVTRKSETASINHKRGRPPAFSIGEDAVIEQAWGNLISSKRSIRNKQYAALGARAICPGGVPDPRYAWLATTDKARQSVLTELGRIARQHGDQVARAEADLIVEMVKAGSISTTREAEGFLRKARLRVADTVAEKSTADARASFAR